MCCAPLALSAAASVHPAAALIERATLTMRSNPEEGRRVAQQAVDQLLVRFPYYKYLLKVKPGLTSWGMVQFGYAENIDHMVERCKFDLLYIENI